LILLDTHVWVWWMSDPARLRPRCRSLLEGQDERFAVSVISCWELAKLVQYGRLQLDRTISDWIDSALAAGNLETLPRHRP
jgi:PIN domain nuclease of toxin-antitoxin system